VLGFIGVTVVLTPGASFSALEHGHLLALLAGLSFAWSTVLVRDLNRTEPVSRTIFYYNIHTVVSLLAIMALIPKPIGWRDAAICVAVGAVFCIKQYAITFAIKFSSASTAAMLSFATIPMLAVYSVVFEGKALVTTTVLGTALVVIGVGAIVFQMCGGKPPGERLGTRGASAITPVARK
jgi:drug/metabolite transporter (DMT)-like permease